MAFSVTYNPNGSTGGSVPAGPTQYQGNATVTVLGNINNLVKAGDTFAYWNTAANGSGTVYGGGAVFVITVNVTLYAQWYTAAGLANSGQGAGITAHFAFQYDSALALSGSNPTGLEPARTNALIASCEGDFNLMSGWFGNIGLPFSTPVSVQVANLGGGARWGPPITLLPGSLGVVVLRYLMISEVTEMLMRQQATGWFAPDNSNEQTIGEGLSRFLGEQFLMLNGLGCSRPGFAAPPGWQSGYAIAPSWLNSSLPPISPTYGSRGDFVNKTLEYDHGIDPATGCAILFLYYLQVQLGYGVKDIIAAINRPPTPPSGVVPLAVISSVYHKLTGDPSDPFPFFQQLLAANFPTNAVSVIPGPNPDNPFPLGCWGGLGALSGCVGDFNGDGIDEILVSSPWGIGVLKKSGNTMTALMVAPNGTRFGGWVLDTNNNRFGPVADYDTDGSAEILVTSPWGIGVLKYANGALTAVSTTANGTNLGSGVNLNTATDQFGPALNLESGLVRLFYANSSGVALLQFLGNAWSLNSLFYTYGSVLTTGALSWTFDPADRFGPIGNFDGKGINEIVVTSRTGLGIIKFGIGWTMMLQVANGTGLAGGWIIDTTSNNFLIGGNYHYDPPATDIILVTSPWGIATLECQGGTPSTPLSLAAIWLAPNGTSLGGWVVDTSVDEFGPVWRTDTASGVQILVTSPWGIGILDGANVVGPGPFLSLTALAMAANGTSLSGWAVDTTVDHFGSVGKYDGGTQPEIFVTSPWGIGILQLSGNTLISPMLQPNGTRLGGWLLDTTKNAF